MKKQKTQKSKHNAERGEQRTDATRIQDLLHSYGNHSSVVLAKKTQTNQ